MLFARWSGCADVTLPYWDVTTPFPDVLKSAPFDKYKLPEAIGGGFDKGYVTQRFPYDEIANNLQNLSVAEDLTRGADHEYLGGVSRGV